MVKCAFYGTLRVDQPNYNAFKLKENAKYLGTAIVPGLSMIDLGWYPMCFEADPKETIVVDLMEVTDERAALGIKRMELGAGYKEKEIEVDGEKYIIYVSAYGADKSYADKLRGVPGGDWVKYNTEKRKNAKGESSM